MGNDHRKQQEKKHLGFGWGEERVGGSFGKRLTGGTWLGGGKDTNLGKEVMERKEGRE